MKTPLRDKPRNIVEETLPELLPELVEFRRRLHRRPELSGREKATAEAVVDFIRKRPPDRAIQRLGGEGAALIYKGGAPGPTVMLRCELDAVPVAENTKAAHASETRGIAHACGHDGHMAMMAGTAALLHRRRPKRGAVVLLFQPAEENAQGAEAVFEDPRFSELKVDFAFALHNHPGYPMGAVLIRPGAFYCASRGMTARLTGASSHASEPEQGKNPALALANIISGLIQIGSTTISAGEQTMATVVHARLGDPGFGVAPGWAEAMATLRAETDETMEKVCNAARMLVEEQAAQERLGAEIGWSDVFPATVNSPDACEILSRAASACRLPAVALDRPFRCSEDFGVFTRHIRGAAFGMGSGKTQPALHTDGYDFPDALLSAGIRLQWQIIQTILSE